MRPTLCEINLNAVANNVRTLISHVAPTPLCAVVKANGYGHGAVEVAKAAVEAGASWLAVALVEEGVELRKAGLTAPILVLSEHHETSIDELIENDLVATVYSEHGIDRLAQAATSQIEVHLGVDTGMRRVGVEPSDVEARVAQINGHDTLRLGALWTHCPVADEPTNPFTTDQLARFDTAAVDGIATHVGNSAVAIDRPERVGAMVRCGISVYGIDPDDALAGQMDLEPAMTIRSAVSFVKPIAAGEAVGYGHRWTASAPTTIATVPIGYADGIRRDLGLRGGEALIGGRRFPIVGVVTMDQLMVDVGDQDVAIDDEVIIIGQQGNEQILAADVARLLDTISYEVICAISERVPRTYVR